MSDVAWIFAVAWAVTTGLLVIALADADHWRKKATTRLTTLTHMMEQHAALLILLAARGIKVHTDVVRIDDLEDGETVADFFGGDGGLR